MEIDYKVGSLSDLITGSKTPNKVAVVKRKFESPRKNVAESPEKTVKKPRKSGDNGAARSQQKPRVEILKLETEEEAPRPLIVPNPQRQEKRDRVRQLKAKLEEKKKLKNNPADTCRTIFVGNVPLKVNKTRVKRFFMKYGKVESVRFRCAPVKTISTPKKITVIKGEFHPDRNSWVSYVKFETEADARNALKANGEIFKDHHIRVSMCRSEEKPDESKAIFVGNVPLRIEDEQLWKTFESCGKIESVRIVRSKMGIGKGFAFVNFASSDSVQLALELNNFVIDKKELRLQHCNAKAALKNKKNNEAKTIKQKKPRLIKPRKTGDSKDAEQGDDKKPLENEAAGISDGEKNDDDEVKIKKSPMKRKGMVVKKKKTFELRKRIKPPPPKNVKVGNDVKEGTETKNDVKVGNETKKDGNTFEKSIAKINNSFEGHKVDIKKKKKKNLGLLRKQKLIKKIAPKS